MDIKDLFNYGVPTGVLLVFLLASWKILVWLKDKVAGPIVDSHISLITVLQRSIPVQAEQLKAVADKVAATSLDTHNQLELLQEATAKQTSVIRDSLEKQTLILNGSLQTMCQAQKCEAAQHANSCESYKPKATK